MYIHVNMCMYLVNGNINSLDIHVQVLGPPFQASPSSSNPRVPSSLFASSTASTAAWIEARPRWSEVFSGGG